MKLDKDTIRRAALFMALAFLPAVAAFGQDSGAAAASDGTATASDGAAAASDGSASASDDDVFGGDETVGEGSKDSADVLDTFIKTAAPVLVGTVTGNLGLTGTWNNPWGNGLNLFSPDKAELASTSGVHLGFSAKPEKDLSFYGEFRTAYPFVKSQTVSVKTYDALGAYVGSGSTTVTVPDISVYNLYAKFDWQDKIFFSFGKQYLKWGLGYFFTPANDIFALSAIDYSDMGAEREGPLSLRVNAPIPGTMATAYLYTVMKSSSIHPTEIGVGPKFEMSFPGIELSLSGYYQKDSAKRLIASSSFGVKDVNFFGEGMMSFGSDRWFVVKDARTVTKGMVSMPLNYRIVGKSDPSNLFFTGTAGFSYSKSWSKVMSLSVLGQYLYDGEGQTGVTMKDMAMAVVDRSSPFYEYSGDPSVSLTDLSTLATAISKFGHLNQHYAGLSVSAGSLFDSDVSVSVLALANLADFSGWVKPQVSWLVFDRLTVSGWGLFSFGDGGDEYTNPGGLATGLTNFDFSTMTYNESGFSPRMQLGLTFSLGSGSF